MVLGLYDWGFWKWGVWIWWSGRSNDVVSVIIWKGIKGNILYGRVVKEEIGIGRIVCK